MSASLDTIEKLIQFMEKHDLSELQVRQGDLEFKARRGERREPPFVIQSAPALTAGAGASPALPQVPTKPPPVPATAGTETTSVKRMKEICAPIVGTFYRCPSPGAPPYKEVGDRVEHDDVVCIIEAMKVMNEIKADLGGVIRKFLVEDATPVEFGQPLIVVELP